MVTPISAPTIVPDSDTVPARCPSAATTTLTPIAHGSVATTTDREAASAAGDIRLISHRTSAAEAGTETLSSSRTGIVSTSAATIAAAIGPAMSNHNGGTGLTAGRVQHASATPATPPTMTTATVPPTVFSWVQCHGD